MDFEFIIPKRPVSLQTRKRNSLAYWKNYVWAEAAKTWQGVLGTGIDIHLTLIYLCDTDPVDIDNIIKPIQDSLIGLVYGDDALVTDISAHRRPFSGTFDLSKCSNLLIQAILSGDECVYVRVQSAKALEDYL
jgi:crossover junction endodeoxyribonuclease RusA